MNTAQKRHQRICNKLQLRPALIAANDERAYIDAWYSEYQKEVHKSRLASKKWASKNRDKIRVSQRVYYARTTERFREWARQSRERRKTDPARLERYNTWCRNNIKRRKATDPEFRIRFLMRNRIWMALQRGVAKAGNTVELLGCTIPEFKRYIESLWLPGMSWENYGRHGWHLDHIKPCASFDLTDPAQQRACFHYSNVQPLWAKDNLSKGDRQL